MQLIRHTGKLRIPMINFTRVSKPTQGHVRVLPEEILVKKSVQPQVNKTEKNQRQILESIPVVKISLLGRSFDIEQVEQDYIGGFVEVKPWQNIKMVSK